MSERKKLKLEKEREKLRSLLRDPESLDKELEAYTKTRARMIRVTVFLFILYIFSLNQFGREFAALVAIPMVVILVGVAIVHADRCQLLMLQVLQEEGSSQEKGEREKLTVEKPCVADGEERVLDSAFEVVIPSFGVDDKRCTIAQWHVADGVRVKKGDTLVTIETDKVTTELEAERDGTLRHKVREGEATLVEGVIGWIE
ncbi:hypothetical protein Rhal01_03734 [Rubritalea halochordaticola]|uniref:Lipoyl-binding domain-containing protein n=1 Tax=Rubritalea halochordaticola TaxID=714537 RepID=A0ABP9V4E1_9BACT